MSDLLGNTNCWFSHAQTQLCLAFNGYSTLMVAFLSSALLRINEAIRTILRQEILIGRAISSRISYKSQNSSYAVLSFPPVQRAIPQSFIMEYLDFFGNRPR